MEFALFAVPDFLLVLPVEGFHFANFESLGIDLGFRQRLLPFFERLPLLGAVALGRGIPLRLFILDSASKLQLALLEALLVLVAGLTGKAEGRLVLALVLRLQGLSDGLVFLLGDEAQLAPLLGLLFFFFAEVRQPRHDDVKDVLGGVQLAWLQCWVVQVALMMQEEFSAFSDHEARFLYGSILLHLFITNFDDIWAILRLALSFLLFGGRFD